MHLETMLNDLHQSRQVRKDSAAHEDGDLLTDFDAGVPGLPALFTLTDSLQEWEEGRDTKGRGNHAEGPGSGVADVLIDVVDIGAHSSDHCGQACSLDSRSKWFHGTEQGQSREERGRQEGRRGAMRSQRTRQHSKKNTRGERQGRMKHERMGSNGVWPPLRGC